MPAFGPAKIRGMFSAMTDIASQLLAKWEVRNNYVFYIFVLFTPCHGTEVIFGIFTNRCIIHF